MAARARDGFRERLNPSYRDALTGLRVEANLLNGITLMLPVQSSLKKYSGSHLTQITSISIGFCPDGGAYRDRHGRGTECDGRELRS
jgi:hypothetical protein